ncbi:MAG: CoA protein activase [Clostridia bacterium]|nr:CoA protein activase [Clostridia bacterium]
MKITFPHMGNTYICAKALLDDLGIEYLIPPFNSKKTLEIGTKYAPEFACLPLKINLGNFLQAYEMGADTILITGGCGPCRFGYYGEMHREILRDIGCEMDVITLEWPDKGAGEFLHRIRKLTGKLNPYRILKAVREAATTAMQADDLERLANRVRPRELQRGTTDRIYKAFLNLVKKADGSAGIKKLIRDTAGELLSIETDMDFRPLRVGIVGEIYSTIDPYTNLNISSRLGSMGIEADRRVTVSGWIIEHMIKKALRLPRDLSYADAAKPYLGAMIGGHAQETVGHTVMYARDGYDGVIQIYPLTCMPEIVAQSILPSVEKDFDIPVLTLIMDEMTGEAGYQTRLEAFGDLLKKRRERGVYGKTVALSGG